MTDERNPPGNCWFRILTAPGPGAVAVIEMRCTFAETAQHALRRLSFGRPGERSGVSPPVQPRSVLPQNASAQGLLPAMSIGRICYGRWNDEDLVVVRTSVLTWEIQCHGGTVAVNRICADLRNDGVFDCDPGTQSVSPDIGNHAAGVEARRLDSVRSMVHEAIRSRLVNARSRRTAGLILAQASNSLCRDLMMILDSPDKDADEVTAVRQRLADWQDVADHLTEPWRVVFAGAPNVGKSSLMNVIAGMERSIVCDQPGTTRDVVEVDGIIEGWPFRFVDTAGLRKSSGDQIEELGIEQSHLAASQCDVLCLVFDDDSDAAAWSDRLSLTKFPKHTVLVRNKCDLIPEHDFQQAPSRESPALSGLPVIHVSARTGQGLPELLRWIRQSVVLREPTKDTALPLCIV
ncbi:MAG: GTP-binding protein [Fuerstia sp.]|nr:GTP-binding protein [Fuerstiella sp.]